MSTNQDQVKRTQKIREILDSISSEIESCKRILRGEKA
jgi:hypothetical protein